jgi:geranylgeranyl diphosphate synthase type II
MIKLKTAVLLGFSLKLGAFLAEASDADCRALDTFGTAIGIGFQLKDDLLDVYGEQAAVGKQVGGDIMSNKKTYLLIKALELANAEQKEALEFWLSDKQHNAQEKVKAVTAIYNALQIKELTEKEMNRQFNQAFVSLHQIGAPEQHVAVLEQFSKNLINRDK